MFSMQAYVSTLSVSENTKCLPMKSEQSLSFDYDSTKQFKT